MSLSKQWEQVAFAALVLVIAFVVGVFLRFLLGRFLKASARKLNVDPTRYNFFKNAVYFMTFLIAAIIIFRSIPSLHAFSTTLITGAGFLAAIVGFASQSAFSNIISGIFLVIFRPFSVGDRIRVGQLYTGDVEDITLRHTVIKDFENRRIIMPNNSISNETIINFSTIDEKILVFIEVTIAFEASVPAAMKIIMEEANASPYCLDNRNAEEIQRGEGPVTVRVISMTDIGVLLRGYAWARNSADAFELKCQVLQSIKEKFDAAHIAFANPFRFNYSKSNS
jgi:small conductance mechanosensitive channel